MPSPTILLCSHSFPSRTCVILIDRTRYEYHFTTQAAVSGTLRLFELGFSGKALAYAKRHAVQTVNLGVAA